MKIPYMAHLYDCERKYKELEKKIDGGGGSKNGVVGFAMIHKTVNFTDGFNANQYYTRTVPLTNEDIISADFEGNPIELGEVREGNVVTVTTLPDISQCADRSYGDVFGGALYYRVYYFDFLRQFTLRVGYHSAVQDANGSLGIDTTLPILRYTYKTVN